MADRQVKVRVDLSATGDLGRVAYQTHNQLKAITGTMAALSKASASIKPINMIGALSAWQNPLSAFKTGSATASPIHSMTAAMSQNGAASKSMIEGMSQGARQAAQAAKDQKTAAKAQAAASAQTKKNIEALGTGAAKTAVTIGALQASAAGFVGAASPAAFQTLTGSIQLAAGEIGIMLIPAIVKVAGFFQDMASALRTISGGLIGSIAKTVAVPLTVVALGAAAIKTGTWLFSLGASAQAAASRLNLISGVRPGAAGGRFSAAGFGAGAALSVAGGAIGGTAGSYLSAAGTGAMIGSVGGPIGAAVGAGVGVLVNAIAQGFSAHDSRLAKLSLNFQGQSSDIGSMHDIIQREAIRDPMQQAQFEQQARATEDLAREVGYLSRAISSHPWQVGA